MRHGRIGRENPPKLCGADVELANFVVGDKPIEGSPRLASRLLLHEMPGLSAYRSWSPPATRHGNSGYTSGYGVDGGYGYSGGYGVSSRTGSGYSNPQDWGRKYLAENGGCAYIDLDHLELALPECISAYDHVAAWHGMLRLAQTALAGANAKLPSGQRIHLLANNSDGLGHSYGSHLNFLVTRRAFDDIFTRRIQPMLTLAARGRSAVL